MRQWLKLGHGQATTASLPGSQQASAIVASLHHCIFSKLLRYLWISASNMSTADLKWELCYKSMAFNLRSQSLGLRLSDLWKVGEKAIFCQETRFVRKGPFGKTAHSRKVRKSLLQNITCSHAQQHSKTPAAALRWRSLKLKESWKPFGFYLTWRQQLLLLMDLHWNGRQFASSLFIEEFPLTRIVSSHH